MLNALINNKKHKIVKKTPKFFNSNTSSEKEKFIFEMIKVGFKLINNKININKNANFLFALIFFLSSKKPKIKIIIIKDKNNNR
jgi:hypothetical protein